MNSVILFDKDSVCDLVCRGFSKKDIVGVFCDEATYKKSGIRQYTYGVDRIDYQTAFIVANVSVDVFLNLLERYGRGELSRVGIFSECGIHCAQKLSLEHVSDAMGVVDAYFRAIDSERKVRICRMKSVMLDRYGCDCPAKIPEFDEKMRATLFAHYGVEHPMQSAELRVRAGDTMASRYGGRYTLTSDVLRERQQATMISRYGVRYSFESDELRERAGDTLESRLGVRNPLLDADIRARRDKTVEQRYGVKYVMQNAEIQRRVSDTLFAKYGVRCLSHVPGVIEKMSKTAMERYGVDWAGKSPIVQARRRETMLRLYGAEYVAQVPMFRDKITATMIERYGVGFPTQSSEMSARIRATMKRLYGVEYAIQSPVFMRKMWASKLANGHAGHSRVEDALHERLVRLFGVDDVCREYDGDFRYPYHCDFYIKSRDLFIELNAFGSHGSHWFGSWWLDAFLLEQAQAAGTSVCAYNDRTWTQSDVKKRETARKNKLNYIVFWGDLGQDVDLWFALDCPDGQDWEREYSWLPDCNLYYDGSYPAELHSGPGVIIKAAHAANWRIFYEGELKFWNQIYDKKWGTIPARLYVNRLKYLGKRPDELSQREILRGLSISGMYHGYSAYNNSGMTEFLNQYKPKFVYDPCAGWGERMLTCSTMNIQYLGVDINKRLMPSYLRLMKQYNLDNVGIIYGDSSRVDLRHGQHDCVFTCPPYEDLEIYTSYGAENLSHDDFIKWWASVVEHAVGLNTRVFAYQVNQVCKDAMNQVLLDAGWSLDTIIPVNAAKMSHLHRAKGMVAKRNFEEIQVFVR